VKPGGHMAESFYLSSYCMVIPGGTWPRLGKTNDDDDDNDNYYFACFYCI